MGLSARASNGSIASFEALIPLINPMSVKARADVTKTPFPKIQDIFLESQSPFVIHMLLS